MSDDGQTIRGDAAAGFETAPTRESLVARLVAKIRGFTANRSNHAIFGTMLLKVASAASSFLLFSLAARAMGEVEFGRFAIWFSLVSLASVVAVFGQELLIVRAWNEYLAQKAEGLAKGALVFGFAVTIGLSIPVGLAIFGYEMWAEGDVAMAVGLGVFLLLHTLLLYTTHASRAIVNIFVGDAHREITWRLVVVVVLIAAMVMSVAVTASDFFLVAAGGIALSVTIQLLAIRRHVPQAVRAARIAYDTANWVPRSWKMWLSAIMESINQYAEVIIIGLLIDPVAAGAYFVAARLANSFAMAADGINTFGTRHIPRLYFGRETAELGRVMRSMALFTALIVVTGLVAVLIGGKLMLWIFGAEYMDQYPILLILSIGTAAVAAAGPAPSILLLTGHEGRYLGVIAGSVAMRCAGFFLLIPLLGVTGAAISTAVSFVAMTMVLNFECRRLTGLDPSVRQLFKAEASAQTVPPADAERSPT
ncbi:lipopolysaccharide biosynthesis protein [Methylobrevis pamukkalensis]|uniref:Polysaccharide biosynthesis protein n=1 Tax=Methylobrevis pamukkalensis TaxID=1439726 RepID=A0A1E3H4X3_9HYPH|nr:polysaccharide biosynthesis C-terminal domain-containing protein [Methylobrevis pamukkalensis]ODN71387.1 Polysaccharide biosynthesis protein [Methylobrevis pamukkalensis]